MNIQVDSTSSNLASAMLNLKIRPRAVVGYGVKIFQPSPPNYVTRSPGRNDEDKRRNILLSEKKTQVVQIVNSSRQHQRKEDGGFLLGGLINGSGVEAE